ncbi:MAG: hypothetical protein RSC28_09435 [Bacteroidales bacterium]
MSTTDSKHSNHIADNLLARDFNVLEPNKFWVSDIRENNLLPDKILEKRREIALPNSVE